MREPRLGAGQGAKRAVVSFTTSAWQRRHAPKTRLALRVAAKKPRLRRCSSLHRMTMLPPRALHTRLFGRNAYAKLSPTGSFLAKARGHGADVAQDVLRARAGAALLATAGDLALHDLP